MRQNISQIKTVEFVGQIKNKVRSSTELLGGDSMAVNIDVNGKADLSDKQNYKIEGAINFNISFISVSLDLKSIGNTLYLKLGNISSILGASAEEGLGSFQDQWIKIDGDTIKNLTALAKNKLNSENTNGSAATDVEDNLTDKVAQFKRIYQESNLINLTEKLGSEKINNINTYHYKFTLDKDEYKKVYLEAIKIFKPSGLDSETEALLDQQLDTQLNSALDLYGGSQGEVWLGQKDYLPYKISLSSLSEESGMVNSSSTIIELKNYNQPVKIDQPEKSKDLASLLSVYIDPSGDNDNDGLVNELEVDYKTDPDNPDTDGDSYKDGDEVDHGYDPTIAGSAKLAEKIYGTTQKNRDAKRLTDVKQLQTALELFYNDNGKYPVAKNIVLGSADYTCLSSKGFTKNCLSGSTKSSDSTYMGRVPANSTPGGSDYIYNCVDGKNYTISFSFETDYKKTVPGSTCLAGPKGEIECDGKSIVSSNNFNDY